MRVDCYVDIWNFEYLSEFRRICMCTRTGASIRNIRFSKALVYGLIFALCSSGIFLLGHGMSTYIFGRPWAILNKYVAIFVFLILGNGMVIYSFKRGKFVERLQEFDTKKLLNWLLLEDWTVSLLELAVII